MDKSKKGKVKKDEVEEKEIAGLRGKHWVK